ncbi:CopG family transcriptional regulator [Nitrosococcus wardiae]|uniref:Ribbon-helix-helix domain-containing protein n=1 Tax=Nitrosococcus wardiae TaxID=1814290 RepID=A0A4V1AW34_9GAMM|nr:ribbon-helix-helix domain-containing protein [Nitrosococcus wardiae]
MKRTNIYIPEELIKRLKAISQGRTLAAMVREAIIFYLEHHEKT